MSAIFGLWRVVAGNGEHWRWLRFEGRKWEFRWRDKGTAGCGGCEVQKSLAWSAIHIFSMLAPRRISQAIPTFLQPSPNREAFCR
jgi:hypothetical protein